MDYDLQAYLQKDDGTSAAVNTRTLFPGMYILEAKGLADYGKPKNIVTESYADGEGLRAWLPTSVAREATDVSLKLFFCDDGGVNRYKQYDDFIEYMADNVVWYWDSVRRRKARLLLLEKSSPTENFHGSIEYIEVEVKFKNIDGYTIQLERWAMEWSTAKCAKVDGANTGIARYKTLTLTRGTETPIVYNITDAFGTFSALTDYNFEILTEANYNTRLDGFDTYIHNEMAIAGYVDFAADLPSIKFGAFEANARLCPIS